MNTPDPESVRAVLRIVRETIQRALGSSWGRTMKPGTKLVVNMILLRLAAIEKAPDPLHELRSLAAQVAQILTAPPTT